LCQFFHENCWFFEAFEITRINGPLILNFVQKTGTVDSWILKCLKNWNWHCFKNSKSCPTLVHIMLISNYLKNGAEVLSWYKLGFTLFLGHGHNKLMTAQTQSSRGYWKLAQTQSSQKYWKLVEKF
jgi:hypothetical protein